VAQKANRIANIKLQASWKWGLEPHDRDNPIAEVSSSVLASSLFLLYNSDLLTSIHLVRVELVCSAVGGEFDKVIWDEAEEVEDASSQAAAESSSATQGDEGNDELEDLGEPLDHSSKFSSPSPLRDWSEDDNGDAGSATTLGGVALHMAATAAARAQAPPTVDLPKSLERCSAASESADPEEAGDDLASAKRKAQPASSEPADKRKKPELAAWDPRRPKVKKVAKRRAIAVTG
jgi:hypothetical protein